MRPNIVKSRRLAKSWRIDFLEDILKIDAGNPITCPRISVPDFTLAVAVRERDGKIPLIRQYRHGARREFWELPGGMVDNNERPLDCIKREFREEVGYELLKLRFIANIYVAPAYSSQVAHVYAGRVGGLWTKRPHIKEGIRIRFVKNTSAIKLLSNGISASHLLAYLVAEEKRLRSHTEPSSGAASKNSKKVDVG